MYPNTPNPNLKLHKLLANTIKEKFDEKKIESLIIHGSSLYFSLKNKPFSDIDAELILKNRNVSDHTKIKDIVAKFPVDLELQMKYLPEINDKNSLFRKSNYKIFLFYAYANGYSIIGDNVYKKLLNSIEDKSIQESILIAAQIEYKNIRKQFIRKNIDDRGVYLLNKTIIRFFTLLLFYNNVLDISDIGTKKLYKNAVKKIIFSIINKYRNILTNSDINKLKIFIKNIDKNRVDSEVLFIIDKVYFSYNI